MGRTPSSTCLNCGEPKLLPKQLKVHRHVYEDDPFCSRDCCREHFAIEPEPSGGYGIDYGATLRARSAA